MTDNYKQTNNGIYLPNSFKSSENITTSKQYAEFMHGRNVAGMSTNYHALATQGFIGNSIAGTCINMVASAVGSLNWIVRDKKTGEILNDTDLEELISRPSPCVSTSEFFYTLQMYKMIDGNSFIRKIVLQNGVPLELELLNPSHIEIVAGNTKIPKAFRYTPNATQATRQITFEVDQVTGESEILQIKYPHPTDPYRGLSPLARAAADIQQMNLGSAHNAAILNNGATPSGVFSFSQEMDEDQQKLISAKINERFVGTRNAGKPIVSSEVKWQAMSQTAKELDFNKSRKELTKNIASVLGVPAQLIGDDSSSTFSNVAEMKLHFYENTVLEQANAIKSELNYWLAPLYGDICIDYDEDQISALQPRRDAFYERYDAKSVMTVDEKREKLGLEPLPKENNKPVEKPTEPETEDESKSVNTLIEVKSSESHTHTIDSQTKSGITSPAEDGHYHAYTLGAKHTAVVDGHRHEMVLDGHN